jgi:glycosyltransferase involved in cell wall biosynthesis
MKNIFESNIIPKISIIVPVYNTERYLERCLHSLLAQTISDIEIIVINDGSQDGSQDVIDRYASSYSDKIRAFRQENRGQGTARNLGLDYACGEYIGFADSDDWVDADMYRQMYNAAKETNSDIVICDITAVFANSEITWVSPGYRKQNPALISISEFVLASLDRSYVWNKLYHRRLFNNIRFPDIWYEDIATVPVLISYAQRIHYLPVPLYFYTQRKNSITAQAQNVKNMEIIEAWKHCLFRINKAYYDEIVYAIYCSIVEFLRFRWKYYSKYLDFFLPILMYLRIINLFCRPLVKTI